MSARAPRKVFATPFVVTLAACGGAEAPQDQVPVTTTTVPDAPTASAVAVVPTAQPTAVPTSAPTGQPAADIHWTLSQDGAKCIASRNVECPKVPAGQPIPTCNPPRPQSYKCPDGFQGQGDIVKAAGKDTCELHRPTVFHQVQCPPGVRCNPPPPQHFDPVPVPCPD